MSRSDYRHATINSAADGWLIPKQEISALLEFCSKDPTRMELGHVVFTDHSIMATDGHRLLLVTQRDRTITEVKTCIAVHRDVLLRARRAMLNKHRERLLIPLTAGQPIEIRAGDGSFVDEADSRETVMFFPSKMTHEIDTTKDAKWHWSSRTRDIVEEQEKVRGTYDHLNPDYFDAVMKACRGLGFRTVKVKFGKTDEKNVTASVFTGCADDHPLELKMVVMGMRV